VCTPNPIIFLIDQQKFSSLPGHSVPDALATVPKVNQTVSGM